MPSVYGLVDSDTLELRYVGIAAKVSASLVGNKRGVGRHWTPEMVAKRNATNLAHKTGSEARGS